VPYDELPENTGLRVRAMILIGQITREVVGNRDITRIKRLFGEGKKIWLKGMLAQLYICCGLTGRKVKSAFKKWIDGGYTMYDPDGYRLLWDPPPSFDSLTDISPMNREGNPIPHLATQFCENAKLARMSAAVQEQVRRLTRPAKMEFLGNIGNLLHTQIQSAIKLSQTVFLNRLNRGSLPYFAPTIFDEDDQIAEQEEEYVGEQDELDEQEEDMNDIFLDAAAATQQEQAERAAIHLPRIFPTDDTHNTELQANSQNFPEINSVQWWQMLCTKIIQTEENRDPPTILPDNWVFQTLREAQDLSISRPFWLNRHAIHKLIRALRVFIPNDNRKRNNLLMHLAEFYEFFPNSNNDQMEETHV
jgi:hypothetical protein